MIEQTMMPVLDWAKVPGGETSFTPASGDVRPSISEGLDYLTWSSSHSVSDHSTTSRRFAIRPPTIRKFRQEFEEVSLLEKWEGFVSEILADGFRAKFRRNSSDFKEVVAEFDTDELSDDDRKILAEGMPLIWSITRERRNGGVQRCSVLIIRRQPRQIPPQRDGFLNRLNDWIRPNDADSASR